jgi:type II secretory pathway component PulF
MVKTFVKQLKNKLETQSAFVKNSKRQFIYGVTDTRNDSVFVKLNDWLIDHSPVKMKEKGIFYNSLQLLVNSGVTFTRALSLLADRSRNPRFERVLRTMVYDMEYGGLSFSRAMAKYPFIFTGSESKMVYSGELSGKINETLESIAEQIQKNLDLESRVKSALTYPTIVFGAIILAGIVVMIFIVPQFMTLFEAFDADLPVATKILINVSTFFQKFWWLVITGLFGLVLLFKNWKATENGKRSLSRLLLNMPLIKTLVQNVQTVKIANNFSTLLRSGIAVNQALHILGEIVSNTVISDAIFYVEKKVVTGTQLHAAFGEDPTFDPILGEVIEIGEQGGNIPEILQKTGQQYEREVNAQLKNLTTIIEPVVILVVGAALVFMAMAILTPIFKIQELFSGG